MRYLTSDSDAPIPRYFWWILGSLFLFVLVFALLAIWQLRRPPYDLIIRGGRVFDGERFLPLPRDVGIRKGKIATIGYLYGVQASEIVDARGMVVSPGFIDTHVHVEASMVMGKPLRAPNFVKMGVTTVVTGNCGTSHAHLRAILDSLNQKGGQINVATLVGHNTIRESVMGQEHSSASPEQLRAMSLIVQDAMRAGAYGVSTGLQYAPGTFADRAEIVALAKQTANYGGIYATHVRDEGNGLMDSLREAVEICKEANIPLHISHLKRASRRDWGRMPEALRYLAEHRGALPALTHDVYPYTRSSSSLDLLLPSSYRGMLGRSRSVMEDESRRKRLVEGMLAQLRDDNFDDYQFAMIAWSKDESFRGKDIPQLEIPMTWRENNRWVSGVVKNAGLANQISNILYVFTHGGAQMIYEVMDDSDMITAMKDPYASIGSDSGVRTAEWTTAHPRSTGTFPKIIGEMVRSGTLELDDALRKMTLQPALIFGLSDRGRISQGMAADLVVFNPQTISGPADYNDLQDPRGIEYVLVNGTIIAQNGKIGNVFPGRPLRKRHEVPLVVSTQVPEPEATDERKTEPFVAPEIPARRRVSKHRK